MPKTLTPEMSAELAKGTKAPIMLISGEFNDGMLYLWTGYGPLSWDGVTWHGGGDFLHIPELPNGIGAASQNTTIQLRGVVLENIELALNQVTQGKPVRIWVGLMDAAGEIVVDPYQAYYGSMDVPEISDDATTVDLSISIEGRSQRLPRTKERRRTHEDQQIDFSDDLGLEYIPSLQEFKVIWK